MVISINILGVLTYALENEKIIKSWNTVGGRYTGSDAETNKNRQAAWAPSLAENGKFFKKKL